mmetsp:Transcript_7605/g.15854  ORF Transcript_7605/g.15854 Transcript_7605/m.15854 type:complete len:87 (+) Transcript_7605:65-325(+)
MKAMQTQTLYLPASMPPCSKDCARKCSDVELFIEAYHAATAADGSQRRLDAEKALEARASTRGISTLVTVCLCVFGMGAALGRRGW